MNKVITVLLMLPNLDNLDCKIKLDDVVNLLDLNQFYFCHLFKESTGIAPYKYVIQQRIEKAKQLIK